MTKKLYYILLLINGLGFGQVFDSIKSIQSIDLDDISNSKLEQYKKNLGENILYLTKKGIVNGTVYINGGENIDFTANITNDKQLSIKNSSINIDGFPAKTIEAILEKIYKMTYTYYSFASNKENILKDFYCNDNDNLYWSFFAIKKDTRKNININESNKLNFKVKLNNLGKIEQITSTLNSDTDDINSHSFTLNFIPYQNGIKLSSYKGKTTNTTSKNSIYIEIEFK